MPVWSPRPEWLREAVASVLAQGDCDLELVIVDDGTPSPVADLLADVDDNRIRHVRIDHGGASAARNAGIAAARGELIRFVDADDILTPGSTARLVALAGDGAISYEQTTLCDETLAPTGLVSSTLEGRIAEACVCGDFSARVVSMLFPRAVVAAVGPWDEELAVGEDWDFVLRCLEHAPVHAGTEVATLYRRHDDSATRAASAIEQGEHAANQVVERYLARHPSDRGGSVERRARANLHREYARAWLHAGRTGRATRHVAALARHEPRQAAALGVELIRSTAKRLLRAPARVVRRVDLAAYGSVTTVDTSRPAVALTYDDGPDPDITPRVLDALARTNARATFFVLGDQAERHPEVVRRARAAGHEIGLHGADHTDLRTISPIAAMRSVRRGRRTVEAILGEPIQLFRPPYGSQTRLRRFLVRLLRLDVVMWSHTPRDWEEDTMDGLVRRATTDLEAGSVLLCHDRFREEPDQSEADRRAGHELDRALLTERLVREAGDLGFEVIGAGELLRSGAPRRYVWVR
jgi:peptidoglycan/xylan/chitin deacetylase (PgdA/CDA1 family)